MTQRSVTAVVMRGGTSRGIFFSAEDVPTDAIARDNLFVEAIGSPDDLQNDGLGGAHSSNSKVMVVGRSTREDCDVDFLFGQVSLTHPVVHYGGNCGSLAAAVAAYAVDQGLVDIADATETIVTMRNLNTGVRIRAHVPVEQGVARVAGDHFLPGLHRPGAPIVTEYLSPGGSVLGSVLPSGAVVDEVQVPGLGCVQASLVDASSLTALVRAEDVGVSLDDDVARINTDPDSLARAEAIRDACARHVGLVRGKEVAAEVAPQQPKLVLCAPPTGAGGHTNGQPSLRVRSFSMRRMHPAFPVTGLVSVAAATVIPGTIPHGLRGDTGARVRLAYPAGALDLTTDVDVGPSGDIDIRSVSVVQTARRLMDGRVFVSDCR